MDSKATQVTWLLGLLGAAGGGVVGFVVFVWLGRQGYYVLALPGIGLGLGAGLMARRHARGLSMVCGVAGALLALVADWCVAPFVVDESFGYFCTHLHEVHSIGLLAIALSGVAAYWLSEGRAAPAPPPAQRPIG